MANRQALEAAFQAADRRLDRLAPLMATYEADRLLDDGGKWTIRDCLCHVAAAANVAAAGERGLARLEGRAPAPVPGAPGIDEWNQQQIEARAGKSVAALIEEAKQAHATAWETIRGMADSVLDTKVPDMQPGRPAASVGGTILRFLEYHEGGQVDRIENALRVRTRWI
jgi:hypothetical protein